ncbi:hypothetical protein BD779DRAFT_1670131 [Infundibulicybe gibba]|nr:hypothetical protein BD779DRAFT_1670131 [Infundibulicybe gibba]
MSDVRRSGRDKQPTAKLLSNQQEAVEEAEVQAEGERKRAKKAKQSQRKQDRAAGIALEHIPEEEREDSVFVSRTVTSRPTTVKQLTQRKNKVPPPHPEPTPRGRSRTRTPPVHSTTLTLRSALSLHPTTPTPNSTIFR